MPWKLRDDDTPLAAPLEQVAQILRQPLPTVERAAQQVAPYVTADGRQLWSVYRLAKLLGMVEPPARNAHIRRGRIVVPSHARR
jgi:hypothetical protein